MARPANINLYFEFFKEDSRLLIVVEKFVNTFNCILKLHLTSEQGILCTLDESR